MFLRSALLLPVLGITFLLVPATPASAANIACNPNPDGTVTCQVSENVPGVGTVRINCRLTGADTSNLPDSVTFLTGNCNVRLTSPSADTQIDMHCGGALGTITSAPALTMQIGTGSCDIDVTIAGVGAGSLHCAGSGPGAQVSTEGVTAKVINSPCSIDVPGVGIGVDCHLQGSASIDPNATPPVEVRVNVPPCD